MKKTYFTLLTLLAFSFCVNAQIEAEDDFESYNLGDISAQTPAWRTWSFNGGPVEDADVVDFFSNSGLQSVLIDGSGVTDMIFLTPSTVTTGIYTIQWMSYIPAGKSGYFNMQAALAAENDPWAQALMGGNVYLNCDGASAGQGIVTGVIDCSASDFTFTYPEDEWFKVTTVWNNDTQTWGMLINDVEQFSGQPYAFGAQVFEELAGLDFFSASTNDEMYIDDTVQAVGELSNAEFAQKEFFAYPNPVTDRLTVQAKEAISTVAIYNVLGQQVYAANVDALSSTIDMSAMTSGAYFVKVNINGTEGTVKVIK